jgi:predicted ATP-grasp superfamily ATP-dependent carboligase
MCKWLGRVTRNFLVFKKKCIGYIEHADVPTLTVLVEKN